ncbi:MAG: uroporphyrinogen decarboxylase family protein [Victivallales bacterium]
MIRCIKGEETDRTPVHLWGIDPTIPPANPKWRPLFDLVQQYGLDAHVGWGGKSNSSTQVQSEARDTEDPDWYDEIRTIITPKGNLTEIWRVSRSRKPGFCVKHMVETVEDARRWLTLPEKELPEVDSFQERVRQVGERAIVCIGLSSAPVYGINALMGSELWSIWLYDERELLHEMVSKSFIEAQKCLKHYLANGLGPLFSTDMPEICVPPLAGPNDFEDFVFKYNAPLIQMIHDAGSFAWIHSHGDLDQIIERFADMGVDCLNPLEPPPASHLTLKEAKKRVGRRITIEGGFDARCLESGTADEIVAITKQLMMDGKPDGRFIMCPASTPAVWPDLPAPILKNYETWVKTALAHAQY